MKAPAPISLALLLAMLALPILQGCAATPRQQPVADGQSRVDELQLAILALGSEVEPAEARRAARVAIEYSRQLAEDYEVTGSPLFHNLMVNLGIKSRGLCKHWTRDLLVRLQQERLRSLDLHWAIANYESTFRIEHSTVVISAHGAAMQQGLVLDGWRHSGDLYWAPVRDDPDYAWRPHQEIFALKDQRAEARLPGRALR